MAPSKATTAPAQSKKKGKAPSKNAPASSQAEEYAAVTNVERVNSPVLSLVHKRMRNAWIINPLHPMWLIFDVTSPVRTSKVDMPFDKNTDLPAYDSDEADSLAKVDDEPTGPVPYVPTDYT